MGRPSTIVKIELNIAAVLCVSRERVGESCCSHGLIVLIDADATVSIYLQQHVNSQRASRKGRNRIFYIKILTSIHGVGTDPLSSTFHSAFKMKRS